MITSVVLNLQPDRFVEFFLIDAGVRSVVEPWFHRWCRSHLRNCAISWIKPALSTIRDLPSRDNLPRETFLRLLLFPLLPAYALRIVWLDADTIVETSIARLWDSAHFGDKALLAVHDYGVACIGEVAGTSQTSRILGLNPTLPYFNAGLLFVDVRRWRELQITEQVLAYCKRFNTMVAFGDQDGLNIILSGRWSSLDLAWNVQTGALRSMTRLAATACYAEARQRRDSLFANPFIIHFAGDKPWEGGLRNPFRGNYLKYLKASGLLSPAALFTYRTVTWLRSLRFYISRRFWS